MTSHLMPTFARVHLAFERGEGVWLVATDGERYLDFTSGVAVNALGHAPSASGRRAHRAGAEALARLQPLRDPGSGARRAAAVRCELRRRGVLLQFGRRGGGRRDQVRAQIPVGRRAARALPHHHLRGRVPRPHAGDARRRRTKEISRRLRPGGRRLRSRSVRRSRGGQTRDRRRDRGDHDRAGEGRGRRAHGRAGVPQRAARAVRRARPHARLRRGAERHGPHRRAVRLSAHRRDARRHVARQGARRRLSGRRRASRPTKRRRA